MAMSSALGPTLCISPLLWAAVVSVVVVFVIVVVTVVAVGFENLQVRLCSVSLIFCCYYSCPKLL